MGTKTHNWAKYSGATIAVAAWLTSGCAQIGNDGTTNTKLVFAEAIEALDDRYIEPIQPDQIMLSGLEELSAIDETLAISRTPTSVALVQDGLMVIERPSPAAENIDGWADLGADLLLDARRASPAFLTYTNETLLDSVFQRLVKGLDRYSRYLSPDDARNSRASREGFGGIGIKIDWVDGNFVIQTAFPDRPAVAAGLKPADRITHVDGHPVHGLTLPEVVKRLRGRVGEAVQVTIIRSGMTTPFDREIVRDYIVASTVDVRRRDKILEVRLTGFNANRGGGLVSGRHRTGVDER